MGDLITPQVRNEVSRILDTWRHEHAKIKRGSLKGMFAKNLNIERLEVTNTGMRCTYRVVRVRKGKVYHDSIAKGGYSPDEEVLEQCAKRFLCFGVFSSRLFARLVLNIDFVSIALFTQRESKCKNISISGPSHLETSMDACRKFFHLMESMSPPPVGDPETPDKTEVLPLSQDHYRVVGVRYWKTNQGTTLSYGTNKSLFIEGVRRDPRVGPSRHDVDRFPSCNIYPPMNLGCRCIGIFKTARATVLNTQEHWYLHYAWWVALFRVHVSNKSSLIKADPEEEKRLYQSWQRERQMVSFE
jgi:hypothetical protein